MDFFSHLIIAVLIARYLTESLDTLYFYYAAFMAILADLDVLLEIIPKFRNSKFLSHKGISHSLFGAILISIFPSLILFGLFQANFLISWIIGTFFYSLHILFDFLTASKIPLFYPLTKKKFRFFIDRAVNPLLMTVSILILIFSIIMRFINIYLLLFHLFIGFLAFYGIYFLYKILTKVFLLIRLPSNSKYVPGVFPFVYYIYKYTKEDSNIRYEFIKKFQFINRKEQLIVSEIEKSSEKMKLLNKSLELTQNYSFFSKWNLIIPIINEDEYDIRISLFLAETYLSNQAYSLTMIYKKGSDELIDRFSGFREKF